MSTFYKTLRFQYFKKWQLPTTFANQQLLFPIEKEYLDRINRTVTNSYYSPFHFKSDDDVEYNRILSFLLEALNFLPLKIDIAFDFAWRAVESMKSICAANGNTTEFLKKIPKILNRTISGDNLLKSTLQSFTRNIPLQTCEYIAKNLLEGDARVRKRMSENIKSVLNDLDQKYKPNGIALGGENARKVGMIFKKLINNEEQIIGDNSNKHQLSPEDSILILASWLLYTYRNNRFHWTHPSPFTSSKATLKTYSHAHYCFLLCNFIFLTLSISNCSTISSLFKMDDIVKNLNLNIDSFAKLYWNKLMD